MAEPDDSPGAPAFDPWEASTWEGHGRWQLSRTLAATPLERLLWLEEALLLAWECGALRGRVAQANAPASPPGDDPAG